MATPVLIIGRSGSGKSTSMRNCQNDHFNLIRVLNKPLPFKGEVKGWFTDDYQQVMKCLVVSKAESIIIDDAGYLITNHFMRGHSSAGKGNEVFALYNDIGDYFWNLIQFIITRVPENKIVYLMMHEEKDDSGDVKPKTIGKLLDEKVCIEGMFTIVLRCIKESGKHGIVADRQQITQNKNDVTTLKEDLTNLSPAIVDTKTGESIVVEDSSGNKLRGLNIYGKSTQVTTTGAQLYSTMPTEEKLINGITFGVKDGGLSLKGTAEGAQRNDDYFFKKGIELSPGTYTISFSGKGNLSEIEVGISGDDKNMLLSSFALYNVPQKLTLSEAKTCYVVAQSRVGKSVDCTIYIMLNAGSSALPYEPYTGGKTSPSVEYPQEITSTGDKGDVGVGVYGGNLLDISVFNDNTRNGVSGKKTNDGGYHIKGTTAEGMYFTGDYVKKSLAPGFYYISDKNNSHTANCRLLARITNNQNVRYYHDGVFQIFENDNTTLYFQVEPNTTVDVILYPMLNAGTNKMPYEPYKSAQIITIPTQNDLPGIKVNKDGNYTDSDGQQWVCDEIDLQRGKYVQRIAKHSPVESTIDQITDGGVTSGKTIMVRYQSKSKNKKRFRCLSNFLSKEEPQIWTRDTECYNHAIDGCVDFRINKDRLSTVDITGIKDFCRKIDAKFYYTLETPIEHDLPPEVVEAYKKLHTNHPTTTITNDENAGMEVSYAADTKNYIDKKFAELNQAIVNTQISLL